jgi:pyruvate dehydrogenase E1 component alpha subunit
MQDLTNAPTTDRDAASLGDLADPQRYRAPIEIAGRSPELLATLLSRMKLVRRAEEAIADLSASGEARCPCHLAVGQEACAIGLTAVLDPSRDRAFGAHRSHGHYLGVGGDVDALFAEVLGRATGCSGGMGGSMHLVAPERGLLGTVPIVGATIPIATGTGLSLKMDGAGGVAVSFFGDGATEEGIFHESMNLAAIHKLPVIFACENNLFSSHLHINLRQPADSVARYAVAHGVAHELVDGNDVLAVLDAAERAVARARAGEGPTFIEMVTYRWRGHVGPREDIDVGVRRVHDLPAWKERDPIRRLAESMIAAGLASADRLAAIDREIGAIVDAAVEKARRAPYPDPDATVRYMYTERPAVMEAL